jgi:hypothetical protein
MDSVLKSHSARSVVFHVASVRFVFGALGKLLLHLLLLFLLILNIVFMYPQLFLHMFFLFTVLEQLQNQKLTKTKIKTNFRTNLVLVVSHFEVLPDQVDLFLKSVGLLFYIKAVNPRTVPPDVLKGGVRKNNKLHPQNVLDAWLGVASPDVHVVLQDLPDHLLLLLFYLRLCHFLGRLLVQGKQLLRGRDFDRSVPVLGHRHEVLYRRFIPEQPKKCISDMQGGSV